MAYHVFPQSMVITWTFIPFSDILINKLYDIAWYWWIFQRWQVGSPEKIPPELFSVDLQHALLHACSISLVFCKGSEKSCWKSLEFLAVCMFHLTKTPYGKKKTIMSLYVSYFVIFWPLTNRKNIILRHIDWLTTPQHRTCECNRRLASWTRPPLLLYPARILWNSSASFPPGTGRNNMKLTVKNIHSPVTVKSLTVKETTGCCMEIEV